MKLGDCENNHGLESYVAQGKRVRRKTLNVPNVNWIKYTILASAREISHSRDTGLGWHVYDSWLTAYWWNRSNPGEKLNVIVQLYVEILLIMRLSIVIFVSSVPLNVAGSAEVLTVVPETPVQLRETLRPGGWLNWSDLASHSYVILHINVALDSSEPGRTTAHTGSATQLQSCSVTDSRAIVIADHNTIHSQ